MKLRDFILTTSRRQCWDTGDVWNSDTDATLDLFMDACSRFGLKVLLCTSLHFNSFAPLCTSTQPSLKKCTRYPFTSSHILAAAKQLCALILYTSSIDSVNTEHCTDFLLRTPGLSFTFTTGMCQHEPPIQYPLPQVLTRCNQLSNHFEQLGQNIF